MSRYSFDKDEIKKTAVCITLVSIDRIEIKFKFRRITR